MTSAKANAQPSPFSRLFTLQKVRQRLENKETQTTWDAKEKNISVQQINLTETVLQGCSRSKMCKQCQRWVNWTMQVTFLKLFAFFFLWSRFSWCWRHWQWHGCVTRGAMRDALCWFVIWYSRQEHERRSALKNRPNDSSAGRPSRSAIGTKAAQSCWQTCLRHKSCTSRLCARVCRGFTKWKCNWLGGNSAVSNHQAMFLVLRLFYYGLFRVWWQWFMLVEMKTPCLQQILCFDWRAPWPWHWYEKGQRKERKKKKKRNMIASIETFCLCFIWWNCTGRVPDW